MLKHHESSPKVSTIHAQQSQAEQNQGGTQGRRHPNTGLRLIETPHSSDPRPTSSPGRPWFAIAAGLLCWLVAGLLIIQL